MATDSDHKPGTPSHIHIGPSDEKKTNWLPWILGALALLALLLLLPYACSREDERAVVTPPPVVDSGAATTSTVVALPGGRSAEVERGSVGEQVGTYLAGNEAAPRTFRFDQLNFDTASAAIRPEHQATMQSLSQVLAAYPNSRVRVVGYADARGSGEANAKLGADRAAAVKTALVGGGVAGDRIETATGGELDPADTNATAPGREDNRRTELEVLSK